MDEAARGALVSRWDESARVSLDEGRLRSAAAAVGMVAAVTTYALHPPFVVQILTGVGVLVSVGWYFAGRNARRRGADSPRWFLALYEQGVLLGQGDQQQWLGWGQVTAVEVDEERLEVVLKQSDAADLRVVPRFDGVAIHDLADRLREQFSAWQQRGTAPGVQTQKRR